ncbi:MAG: phosphoglycolate phosphatase [Lentisphaerae bacterium ADurb.Bin242]|nr:MAG: phosphoglycolate phosphatase [Lentisphaerae bacterium ADurb.Bin242]
MKKLFITDLDGTALGGGYMPYSRFPDHFSEFLDRLSDNGWDWAINTTWDPEGQWKLVLDSSVRSHPSFLIGEYGRQLVRIENGNLIRVQNYCVVMEKRLREFQQQKMIPMFFELMQNFPPKRLLNWVHLFSYAFDETDAPEKIEVLLEKYLNDPALDVHFEKGHFSGKPAFLGKGVAVNELIKLYGYSPEAIVCAGDEIADLDMMKCCSHSICPDNACEKVKEYIAAHGGVVGYRKFAAGIIEAFGKLEDTFHGYVNA